VVTMATSLSTAAALSVATVITVTFAAAVTVVAAMAVAIAMSTMRAEGAARTEAGAEGAGAEGAAGEGAVRCRAAGEPASARATQPRERRLDALGRRCGIRGLTIRFHVCQHTFTCTVTCNKEHS